MDQDNRITKLEQEIQALKDELSRVQQDRIQYLQNVAHQLVAPLNAIKWHIENITSARIGVERGRKVLRSIYSQATLAVHLAKNFALMSNLEQDHTLEALKEPLQTVSLCKVLINLVDDFQPQGWDKEVAMGVEEHPLDSAPHVQVIKPLISQVFSNLIENAVKYCDKKSRIIIEGQYDKVADEVTVRVINSGIPLSVDDALKVLERGYRTQAAKQLYPAGTGFGLYIAKRIVEIHRGKLRAYTDAKKRTVFEVTLPVTSR